MSKSFIDEVQSIVVSNIADENFGVRELASSLHLSSSQTLRKVKAATGKSVNQYIRELRLEKAAKLLKKTDLTAAEIAYQVGFNSASYFNKTFSKYFGIAPGEYKTRSISLSELTSQKEEQQSKSVSPINKLIYAASIVLVLVLGYVIMKPFSNSKNPKTNSIAVLPFKDLSPEDMQWFSDGVSDIILHSLAQIHELSVISFTSSSTYRDSDKQIPQIAEELGVSYILEGSVTLYDNKIKIIAQLINAKDEHIWSKEYNESFDDIINVQNNVAQEVMRQMEITLNTDEVEKLNTLPTENMEAYNLFLKGRLVDDSRRKEDLWNNIELNKQAIVLDSNFAEAYAEIALSYWKLGKVDLDAFIAIEGSDLAHKYADSALNINPNTYRALAIKAELFEHVDWDKANAYYKKALDINPNDALTHIQYAIYFQTRPNPDIKKYLKHLTISQQLNPISWLQAFTYTRALIFNNKIKEAEEFLERNSFQLNPHIIRQSEYKIIAYKNKDWTQVIPFLKGKLKKDPDNSFLYSELAFTSHAILNDDSAAVAYMKKAYMIDSLNLDNIVRYFNVLLEDKKYEEAYKLMELENYNLVLNNTLKLKNLWNYHYMKGDSKKALEISKDTLFTNDYLLQVLTYAQLGDRKKVDSINKKHPHGSHSQLIWRTNRAILHAVLKEKDSMYYYLEKSRFDDNVLIANGRSEFDPYRNEERFKAFLRMNYLPIPEEQ
jgi:TolB-like protein/AraC-like DNA-binding protein